jgi:hypothetical protein
LVFRLELKNPIQSINRAEWRSLGLNPPWPIETISNPFHVLPGLPAAWSWDPPGLATLRHPIDFPGGVLSHPVKIQLWDKWQNKYDIFERFDWDELCNGRVSCFFLSISFLLFHSSPIQFSTLKSPQLQSKMVTFSTTSRSILRNSPLTPTQ